MILAGWQYNLAKEDAQRARDEHATLEEGLRQKITIREGQIEILKRQKDGTVIVKRPYKPPEGSIVIRQKDLSEMRIRYRKLLEELKNAETPEERKKVEEKIEKVEEKLEDTNDDIELKNKGFVFRPGLGVDACRRGPKPSLDLKWVFWDR